MSEVTQILDAVARGDPSAASQLLPVVYVELRQLAAHKLSGEKPGQTLQPTALVHEAYLRLVGNEQGRHWDRRRVAPFMTEMLLLALAEKRGNRPRRELPWR